jgi:cyanophycinase-like exopeptidase
VLDLLEKCRSWSDRPEEVETRRQVIAELRRRGTRAYREVADAVVHTPGGEWDRPLGQTALRVLLELGLPEVTVNIARMTREEAERAKEIALRWVDQLERSGGR